MSWDGGFRPKVRAQLFYGGLVQLLAGNAYSGAAGITTIGGYLGLVTAALAWYASFAGVTNAT